MPEKKADRSVVEPDKSSRYYSPTAYCEKCKREVEYLIHRTRRYGLWHGIRYRYKGKKANCRECGATVILLDVLAYNMKRLAEESKKEKYKETEQHDDSWRIARNCVYPPDRRVY